MQRQLGEHEGRTSIEQDYVQRPGHATREHRRPARTQAASEREDPQTEGKGELGDQEAKGLKEGHGVIVQVTAFAEEGKATPAATRVLYKGRTIIHTPGAPGINVSRQIKDPDERKRLTSIIEAAVSEKLQEVRDTAQFLEPLQLEPVLAFYKNLANEVKDAIRRFHLANL